MPRSTSSGDRSGEVGCILVEPAEPDYWPPAHRELTLSLDDILLEDGKVAPFSRLHPTFTAMGRFGNVMLVNGAATYSAKVAAGNHHTCALNAAGDVVLSAVVIALAVTLAFLEHDVRMT